MKTAPQKAPRRKESKASSRTKPPAKCPDFERELKAIYGNKTFDHLLVRYDEAVF